ncbi:MAG: hypothetical protein ACFFDN_14065 [Candidatus Hodarchaeota archaeon]
MCNHCYCPEMDKCSARGYGSSGFCCQRCEIYDPMKHCLNRYATRLAEKLLTPEELERARELDLSIEFKN